MEENRIVCFGLDMYKEWEKIELYVLVWTCTGNGRKQNCVCWFGHVLRMGEFRIIYVGMDMYTEWKKTELYVLVRTCTENWEKIE